MPSQLYIVFDLERGVKGGQQREAIVPAGQPGQDDVSAKPRCQGAQVPVVCDPT